MVGIQSDTKKEAKLRISDGSEEMRLMARDEFNPNKIPHNRKFIYFFLIVLKII